MRSNQQSGDSDSGNSGFGSSLLGGSGFTGRRPWFGPKRIGWGYSPQTWQGWLLIAVLTALVITAATLAPQSPWFFAALAALFVVPFAVIGAQRRR